MPSSCAALFDPCTVPCTAAQLDTIRGALEEPHSPNNRTQEARQYQDHEDLKKRVHCTVGGAERFARGQAAQRCSYWLPTPRDEGQSKAAATAL